MSKKDMKRNYPYTPTKVRLGNLTDLFTPRERRVFRFDDLNLNDNIKQVMNCKSDRAYKPGLRI